MKNIKTKLKDFIKESDEFDPYDEEGDDVEQTREEKIENLINEFKSKFHDPNIPKKFVDLYSSHKKYNNDLINAYADTMDEDEYDDAEQSGDFNEFVLDNACGDFEWEYLTCDVLQDKNLDSGTWCDFYNELIGTGW